MEQFQPLFKLLLSSPSPKTLTLATNFLSQPNAPPLTFSLLSLLLSPVPSHSSLIFLQTLPLSLQSSLLCFLSNSPLCFDPTLLCSLAHHLLNSSVSSFWVKRAALKLLDESPDGKRGIECNDLGFLDLPNWVKEGFKEGICEVPCLSWLPFDISSLPMKRSKNLLVPKKDENFQSVCSDVSVPVPVPKYLSDYEIEIAMDIKREIGTVESVQEAIAVAKKIQQLCTKAQSVGEILNLIEPWEINDDLARILLSNLSFETENKIPKNLNYSSIILSSIILPKLLLLKKQPSSILISTTLEFCKEDPVSAVDSILIPLIFRNEGLNIPLCDLITKIVKDCLHPLQISFFIQKILSNNKRERKFTCLNRHLEYISDELVWNESLFQLFYNTMNNDKDIFLTPDSIEKLVLVIEESAPKFAKSLKFGNFVLCFVTKFGSKLEFEKDLLERSVEKTDTFVTKAILAKLHAILI